MTNKEVALDTLSRGRKLLADAGEHVTPFVVKSLALVLEESEKAIVQIQEVKRSRPAPAAGAPKRTRKPRQMSVPGSEPPPTTPAA